MFMNPMDTLPGYGEVLSRRCNFDRHSDERTGGDLIGAVLDYLIGEAWSYLGLFPEEEERHLKGMSIMEIQTFLDWATWHLFKDMKWEEEEINKEIREGIKAFKARQEEIESNRAGEQE